VLGNSSLLSPKDEVDIMLYHYQREFGLSYRQAISDPYERVILNLAVLSYYNQKEEAEIKKAQSKIRK
jgi:hypothetical protein